MMIIMVLIAIMVIAVLVTITVIVIVVTAVLQRLIPVLIMMEGIVALMIHFNNYGSTRSNYPIASITTSTVTQSIVNHE